MHRAHIPYTGGCRVPGAPENASRTREGGFRYRISLPYQRSLFCAPSAPENASRTTGGGFRYRISLPYHRSLFFTPGAPENAPRTTGACFLHRAHIPYHRRPSPVPNATNTTQSHPAAQTTASSTPSLRTSASWKPPGTRNNRFAEKPLQLFQKIAGTFTQFFIFVPNKYRNTQCKHFTTNTTNSWNLPR